MTITLGEISDNELTGTLVHSAGDDGAYGNFWGVYAPYSVEAPLDMNPRLRHLLPPGESQWTLDLTTNQMKITQNNVSSTMIFGTEATTGFSASCCPAPPENRDATRSTTTCGAVRRNSSTSCIRSATDRRTNR